MNTAFRTQIGFGLLTLLAAGQAFAQQSSYLGISGFQASSDASYGFAGVIVPFDGGQVGEGPYYKAIVSWLRYEYNTPLGNQQIGIRANAPGIEAGAGYAFKGENYGIDVSATLGYRNISVKPFVPPDEKEGNVFTLNPQVQARYQFAPTVDADLIASYAFGQDTSFSRARLGWKPEATWRTGVEAIRQSGANYRVNQQGLFAVKQLQNGLAVEFSGGRAESRDGSTSGYGGLGLAKMF